MDHLGSGAGGIAEVALQLADHLEAAWHRAGQGTSLTDTQRVPLPAAVRGEEHTRLCKGQDGKYRCAKLHV